MYRSSLNIRFQLCFYDHDLKKAIVLDFPDTTQWFHSGGISEFQKRLIGCYRLYSACYKVGKSSKTK